MEGMKLLAAVPALPADTPAPLFAIEGVFTNAITIVIGLAGIILFIMFIVGGFQWLTAGGNPQTAEGAKKEKQNS